MTYQEYYDIRKYNGIKEDRKEYYLKNEEGHRVARIDVQGSEVKVTELSYNDWTWKDTVFVLALFAAVLFFIWMFVMALFQRPGQPFSFTEAWELTKYFISRNC
ncbi:MAG: hypothetical protein J6Y28_07875 [Acholeplasmatales bacterium]|nr:hypothetical protein [Acholeplasmatales bacterium]